MKTQGETEESNKGQIFALIWRFFGESFHASVNFVFIYVLEFSAVCQESTDFHFPYLEQQFERIEQEVVKANEWRQQQKLASEEGGDQISIKSSGSSSSEVCDWPAGHVECLRHIFEYKYAHILIHSSLKIK